PFPPVLRATNHPAIVQSADTVNSAPGFLYLRLSTRPASWLEVPSRLVPPCSLPSDGNPTRRLHFADPAGAAGKQRSRTLHWQIPLWRQISGSQANSSPRPSRSLASHDSPGRKDDIWGLCRRRALGLSNAQLIDQPVYIPAGHIQGPRALCLSPS